jgi:hypothetical protein
VAKGDPIQDPMQKFVHDLDGPKVQKPTLPLWISYLVIGIVVGLVIWGLLSK